MSFKPGQSVNVLCGGGRVWRKGAVVRRIYKYPSGEWYEIVFYKRGRNGKLSWGNFSINWLEKETIRERGPAKSLMPRPLRKIHQNSDDRSDNRA